MKRTHDELIQTVRAELEARDICMQALYALQHLVTAVESGDPDAVKSATTQARVVLNKTNLSTR